MLIAAITTPSIELLQQLARPIYRPALYPAGVFEQGLIIGLNEKRRHLDASQRAMVAAKIANLDHGGDRSKPSIEGLSTEIAAGLLNVGRATVERARTVQRAGAPELVTAVELGRVAVSAAAEIARR